MRKLLSIVWWNTGLNPPRGKTKVKDIGSVYSTIAILCKKADIVLLGECRFSEHKSLWCEIVKSGRGNSRMMLEQQNVLEKNHITLLHRKKFTVSNSSVLKDNEKDGDGSGRRVALLISIGNIPSVDMISFYAIHWPSLIYDGNMFAKENAARIIVQDMKTKDWPKAICIGDFNAEPYQRPFAWLRSSRSRKYTNQYGFFYNPFWRFLHDDDGTIAYRNNCELHCLMPLIDQAIISRRLLQTVKVVEAEILSKIFTPRNGEHIPICINLKS